MKSNQDNNILHITVSRKDWNLITSGEKTEIYLEPRYYWYLRLLNVDREGYGYFGPSCDGDFEDLFRESNDSFKEFTQKLKKGIEEGVFEYKGFSYVILYLKHRNGTPHLIFKLEAITIGTGNKDWGAKLNTEYFIIKLGERVHEPQECQHYYVEGCHEDILCSFSNPTLGCFGICKNFKTKTN